MPWTMDDYPASMKNLVDIIRKKAIDIANSMIDEGYEDDQAIPIAINQAKEWHENAQAEEVEHYRKYGKPTIRSKEGKKYNSNPERMNEEEQVLSHKNGWAVKSSGSEHPSDVFKHKAEAISRGKVIAENKATSLTVYKKDGTIQSKQSFNE